MHTKSQKMSFNGSSHLFKGYGSLQDLRSLMIPLSKLIVYSNEGYHGNKNITGIVL